VSQFLVLFPVSQSTAFASDLWDRAVGVADPATAVFARLPTQNQVGSSTYVVNAWLHFGRRLILPGQSGAT
jgi:hypothetical protein